MRCERKTVSCVRREALPWRGRKLKAGNVLAKSVYVGRGVAKGCAELQELVLKNKTGRLYVPLRG